MYRLIAFNEVSANFTAHFGIHISPYFDRQRSNASGRLHFLKTKFVRYLVKTYGYQHTEPLKEFVSRKYGPEAATLLSRLMC